MTFQFQTIVRGEKNSPVHTTFMQAWNDMYLWVEKQLAANTLSMRVLETCIWIETIDSEGHKMPMMFPDARDHAIRNYNWKKPQI